MAFFKGNCLLKQAEMSVAVQSIDTYLCLFFPNLLINPVGRGQVDFFKRNRVARYPAGRHTAWASRISSVRRQTGLSKIFAVIGHVLPMGLTWMLPASRVWRMVSPFLPAGAESQQVRVAWVGTDAHVFFQCE